MARLTCDSLAAFGLLQLVESQEKSLSGCFKFDDLSLRLAEAMKILKVLENQRLLLFETVKIVDTIFQCYLFGELGCGYY